jgi:hypothetical protein
MGHLLNKNSDESLLPAIRKRQGYLKLRSSTSISEQRPSGEQFREATVDPEDTPEILRVNCYKSNIKTDQDNGNSLLENDILDKCVGRKLSTIRRASHITLKISL